MKNLVLYRYIIIINPATRLCSMYLKGPFHFKSLSRLFLFDLVLFVSVNIFSVMLGQIFLG